MTNRKKSSALLIIKEIHIKMTVRSYPISKRTACVKKLQTSSGDGGTVIKDHSFTTDGNVNWFSIYVKQFEDFPKH